MFPTKESRKTMVYYTQILFVQPGQETVFRNFEEQVRPLLQRHHGELLYRVRPTESSVVATTLGNLYKIHLVSFRSREDFETYRDDPQRLQYMPMKDQSIERHVPIAARLLSFRYLQVH